MLACLAAPLFCFSQPTGPLFQLLAPTRTNVNFQNTVTDEKDRNILIYSNYYGGGGVGTGDFNHDGLADLFFAGNLVSDRLYFNKGHLTFQDVTEEAGIEIGGGWSSGVVVGDVNNDGWDDIYVTRELYDNKPELRRNKLYINQQNGTFLEQAAAYGLDNSERTRHATFIDYDKDGWLDLFLINQPPNPGNYSPLFGADLMKTEWSPRLYKNNTNGSFSDVSEQSGVLKPGYGNSAVAADLNNDGWQDLYLTNDYEAPDRMYINNGDGTFTDVIHEAERHISYYAMGVDAADINNDGWLDVMTLDMVAEDNFRLKANMGGMYPEAFWKIVDSGGHHQYMFNALHLNEGVGTPDGGPGTVFSDIAQMAGLPSTDWSWSNVIADFDNDGWKDIFVTNGLLRDIRNSDAAKSFPKYVQHAIEEFIAQNPNAGEVGIFDILDLDEALAQIPSVPLKNYVFKNNGDLTFTKKTTEWGMGQETFSNGCAYADLDNDGDLEIVVNNINAPASIFENKSQSNWLRVRLSDSKNNQALAGTKVRILAGGQAQYAELTNTRGMYSTSENLIHFGLGKKTKVDEMTISWPDGQQSQFQDLQANQLLEIDLNQRPSAQSPEPLPAHQAFQNITDQTSLQFVHEENNFDDYAKQVLLPHKLSQSGPALAVADVDDNGLEDVFAGGATGQSGTLFLQRSPGVFEKRTVFEEENLEEDIDAVFFDSNGDGDMDLYVVSGGNEYPQQNKMYQDRLYINDGNGHFTYSKESLPVFRDSGGCVKPADFDGDGDLDLFVGGRLTPWDYPAPAISRLLRNDGGKFTDITKTNAPGLILLGLVTDAVWSDFDGDNDLDLIAVGEWMPITVFENNGGIFTATQPLDASSGWWYSIAAADVDGDGDDDYFVGNLGLNYKYKASESEPFEVHYGDFDGSGTKDIVLSYYNFGQQFPLRGRSCSSQQVPVIKEKFPSYNVFASAKLADVYGEEKLEKSLHYAAQTFASVFVENKGSGHLSMTPLPNEAQVSSINGFLVKDFNGDQNLDVLLAGGLFPAEIETPRNDAGIGLLMLGDGQRHWTPVPPAVSNISVPFDVKKIRPLGDLVLFGVNDGKMQVYSIPTQKTKQ